MRYFLIAVIIIFIISGCSSYIPISDIKENPMKYQNRQISVKGRVTETFAIPFINKGMYEISDNDDSIWVLGKVDVPFRGDRVVITGKVKTALMINNRTFGTVIVED